MSAKKRTSKPPVWLSCKLCGCQYPSFKDHAEKCTADNPLSQSENPSDRNGLIIDKCLLAKLVSANEGLGSADIAKHWRDDQVFMNPVTMQELGVFIGKPLIINNNCLGFVWPEKDISLTDIGVRQEFLSNNLCKEIGGCVPVCVLPEPYQVATEIQLSIEENNWLKRDALFLNHVRTYLQKKFVSDENYSVLVPYTANIHRCSVVKIIESSQSNPDHEKLKSVQENEPSENNPACSAPTRNFFEIGRSTRFVWQRQESPPKEKIFNLFGGYVKQKEEIINMVEQNIQHHAKSTSRGILLCGPSGCGKTMLARGIGEEFETRTKFVSFNAFEIAIRYLENDLSSSSVTSLFRQQWSQRPFICFLDGFHALCPHKDAVKTPYVQKLALVVAEAVDLLLSNPNCILLIAATHKPLSVDPDLLVANRLGHRIELGPPTPSERFKILKNHLSKIKAKISNEAIQRVADGTHAFSGFDLKKMCDEAKFNSSERPEPNDITLADLVKGFEKVKSQSSDLRATSLLVEKVLWDDVAGQTELKQRLRQVVEWPIKHPDAFDRLGTSAKKGLLMYGPPGCSKTMLAKAVATECGLNFFAVKGSELLSKYVGESEKNVRDVFSKARLAAPSVIFFDEIDSIAVARGVKFNFLINYSNSDVVPEILDMTNEVDSCGDHLITPEGTLVVWGPSQNTSSGGDATNPMLSAILTEIDGIQLLKGVSILAATNLPNRIDKALLRPGRLGQIIYVPLPDKETRREIFVRQFKKIPASNDICIDELVEKSEGFSGAEVVAVCRRAGLLAMREDLHGSTIYARHFNASVLEIKPVTSPDMLEMYKKFAAASSLTSV